MMETTLKSLFELGSRDIKQLSSVLVEIKKKDCPFALILKSLKDGYTEWVTDPLKQRRCSENCPYYLKCRMYSAWGFILINASVPLSSAMSLPKLRKIKLEFQT